MAGKKSKRGKTVKGRKVAKRTAKKQLVLKLPPTLGKVVAAAVVQGMNRAIDSAIMDVTSRAAADVSRASTSVVEPSKPEPRLAHVGADQRYTKNIGNYESFVFGFSLNIPVEIDATDSIESAETRAKLRPKYEATMGFLNEMLKEVGKEVDSAHGVAVQ